MKTALPLELQAARLRLVADRPYLASAAWALRPIERPGLGSVAVDRWWRLYFDPAAIRRWSVEELVGVLYHEILHLLRDHASRLEGFDHRLANVAADAEINDDILAERVRLPDGAITPKAIGQPNGLLAEEYISAMQQQTQGSACHGAGAGADGGAADSSVEGGDGDNGDAVSGDSSTTPGTGTDTSGDDASDDTAGSTTGSAASRRTPDASIPTGGRDTQTRGSAATPRAGASGTPTGSAGVSGDEQTEGDAGSTTSPAASRRSPDTSAQTPTPGAGRCGSCATGRPEAWEEGPPSDPSDGVGRTEAELIRRDVAQRIREHSRGRGSVPSHLERWADERLAPAAVNWRRVLAAAIRAGLVSESGSVDYTYSRPSRRQSALGRIVLPALRKPTPNVAIVVDTSGSVDDEMLAQAMGEVGAILRAVGHAGGIYVISADAAAHTCQHVRRVNQVRLVGGGGTDMGAGLEAAAKLRPQVTVVLTDGDTPWPSERPKGLRRVIVGALGGRGACPEWARRVDIDM